MDLVCPAGTLPALKAAVDHGADWVYLGFRDETNARNFAGLNFDAAAAREGIAYAHARGARVLVAINTYPQTQSWRRWTDAVDRAADVGADAVILADLGLLRYAASSHPRLALHLSVQGSATSYEAINLYRERFGIRRAVLPRVLSLAQVEQVVARTPVEIEVFGFGGLCVMVEGRCLLSSFVTGKSPNTAGVCSPSSSVRWEPRGKGMDTRVGPVLVNRHAPGEKAGYPTLCKGRYQVATQTYYAFEEPVSLNTLALLPQLASMGVAAIKLEGRQRSPAYVEAITRVWRAAIDACCRDPAAYSVRQEWAEALAAVSEGQQCTLGAYHRPWK
jgi:collagenase-like PrtC family protease